MPAKKTTSDQVFVIMPINPDKPEFDDVLDSIKYVASNSLGLAAYRIDDEQSNEKITDRIMKAIENASYIVADLTDLRPNVFFEAGYAHGIGKLPVYIARKGTVLAFDLKDYPVIFFTTYKELKEQLGHRLKSIRPAGVKTITENQILNENIDLYEGEDAKAHLAYWVDHNKLDLVEFSKLDKELNLKTGSTETMIEQVVRENKPDYHMQIKGENSIRFKYVSRRSRYPSGPNSWMGV